MQGVIIFPMWKLLVLDYVQRLAKIEYLNMTLCMKTCSPRPQSLPFYTFPFCLSLSSSSSSSSSFYSLSSSPLACVSAAYFTMDSLRHEFSRQFLSSTINGCLTLSDVFVCFPACTHANYTGFFVAEKNAFKLILTSVKKTKNWWFFCNRAQKQNAVAMNFWKIYM